MVSTAPKSAEKIPDTEPTVRLTVAQATIRFLANQYVERDGERTKFFAGCFGIFGHGNVAGLGQALLQAEVDAVRGRYRARAALCAGPQRAGDGAQRGRATPGRRIGCRPGPCPPASAPARRTCSPARRWPPSTGCPCCCCPPTRSPPEPAHRCCRNSNCRPSGDVTVNDAFKPLSRYFDRVWRPEQLPAALLGAMRVLTDPVETGAATVAIPQDVQAEAYDWPESLFAERTWHVARPLPERSVIARAADDHPVAQRSR